MRKLTSTVLVAVMVSVFGVAGEAAAAPVLNVREVRAATTDPVTAIDVEAYGDNDIVSVKATVRLYRSGEVISLLDAFERVSGSAQDGVWRSASPVDLTGRNVSVIVHLRDATGYWRDLYGGAILNGLRPVFAEFGISPDHVDADHADVTYRGRLVVRRDDGTEYGLEAVPVYIRVIRDGSTVLTTYATTDVDGWFTGQFRYSGSGSVVASVSTTATYVGAASDPVTLTGRIIPTRVSLSVTPLPAPYYVVGDTVTLAGKLEAQNWSDEWYGLGGKTLQIYHRNSETQTEIWVSSTTTAPDGSYSVPLRVPAPGRWRVAFEQTGYAFTNQVTDFLDAQYRTQVSGFNVSPEPVAKGGTVTARGTVLRTLASGASAPATYGWADLYFSPDGSVWTHVVKRAIGSNGTFSITETATRDGYWHVRYEGGAYTLDSVSDRDYVDTRYETEISNFNAGPEPVRRGGTVTVSGVLLRPTPSLALLSGKTVYVYFVPKGSTTATYMGSDTTDSSGDFKRSFTIYQDGYWYAKYKGSSTYMPVTSSWDFVDVT